MVSINGFLSGLSLAGLRNYVFDQAPARVQQCIIDGSCTADALHFLQNGKFPTRVVEVPKTGLAYYAELCDARKIGRTVLNYFRTAEPAPAPEVVKTFAELTREFVMEHKTHAAAAVAITALALQIPRLRRYLARRHECLVDSDVSDLLADEEEVLDDGTYGTEFIFETPNQENLETLASLDEMNTLLGNSPADMETNEPERMTTLAIFRKTLDEIESRMVDLFDMAQPETEKSITVEEEVKDVQEVTEVASVSEVVVEELPIAKEITPANAVPVDQTPSKLRKAASSTPLRITLAVVLSALVSVGVFFAYRRFH